MNLYQKIVEVRKTAKGFKKDKKSYNYSYVTGDQILNKIRDKMNELNLLLIPSTRVGEYQKHEYTTSRGKPAIDFIVSGEMNYTWINGDKPDEKFEVEWAYYGQQDDVSRAYGSALTYSERYFLLKCLGLPTDEDDPDEPENYSRKSKGSQQKKPHQQKNKVDKDKQAIVDGSLASEAQVKYIANLLKKKNYTDSSTKEYLKKTYNKDDVKALSKKEAGQLINMLNEI